MRMRDIGVALAISLSSVALCSAQGASTQGLNTKVSSEDFRTMAGKCAPDVPLVTLRAIARAESAFHPYALSLDYPLRTAREQGLSQGGIFLARQPRDAAEARTWAHWLVQHGHSVSIGLMQISTRHARDLNLTADQLFDPCTNLRAGAQILKAAYQQAAAVRGKGQDALRRALSSYNSGSEILGFDNGYVSNVVEGDFDQKIRAER